MKTINCMCTSAEHMIRISIDEDGDCYIDTQLTPFSFWYRLWAAFWYVCGYQSCYGHWEETMLSIEQQEEVIELLQNNILAQEINAWNKASDEDLEEMLNTQDLWEE